MRFDIRLQLGMGILLLACWSCTDKTEDTGADAGSQDSDPTDVQRVQLNGAVDKGPFVLGSSVEISPVDANGSPTGQVFSTQTTNDLGEFDIEFDYLGLVSLKADGFYYNEATGALSAAPITLRAFYEVTTGGSQSAFINLITHLSYNRTKNLMINGMTFWDAVAQAEAELRAALEIGPPGFDPEALGIEMNITGGESLANAYLFAVSAVLAERARLEGGPIDAAFQELLNTIAVDFADDGDIDPGFKGELWEAQFALDVEQAMSMLADRLANIGSSAVVPDINLILDLDQDGVVNALDCLIYDPTRWTDNADLDGDGVTHYRCGGLDLDDDCAECLPGGSTTCGFARDFDGNRQVDELTGCGTCSPGTPHLIGELGGMDIRDLFVVGSIAYLATGNGLAIVDTTNPQSITQLGSVPGAGPAETLFAYGELVCTASESELQLIDVSQASAPSVISSIPFGSSDLFVSGGLVFTPYDLIDVSNPLLPIPLSHNFKSMDGDRIFLKDRLAVVLAGHGELSISDISDPLNPMPLGSVPLGEADQGMFGRTGLFVSGHRAAIVGPSGLALVDITDPAAPQLAGGNRDLGNLSDVFVVDDTAYVVGEHGLFAVDISDPHTPVVTAGPLGHGFVGAALFIAGQKAYVGDASGLYVFDLDCGGELMIQCGNQTTDWGEECDDTDFAEQSCNSFGFGLGELTCNDDCTLDDSACTNCGNGQWDGGEECDGDDLNFQDCWSFGFGAGELGCTDQCQFDSSDCHYVCGDGRIDPGEECEHAWDPWGDDDLDGHTCQDFGFANELGLKCDESCALDPSGCQPVCDNGMFEPGEACEGDELNGKTCADFGFIAAEGLSCTGCDFDLSGCVAECGNQQIEPTEECEGDDLGGATCGDLGYLAPDGLSCASCQFDDSACTAECGNGVVEPGEGCDDHNLNDPDGCTSTCTIEEGWQCLGQPSVCDECEDYHHGSACDRCIVLVNPDERIDTRDGRTWRTGFADIPEAIAKATELDSSCHIWVRHGEYPQPMPLDLPNEIHLFGGFDGTESTLEDRDVTGNETVLESVIQIFNSENVRFDGFTLRGGLAEPGEMGAGVMIHESSATLAHCEFTGYQGHGDGGAVHVDKSDVRVSHCSFDENEAQRGGGLFASWSSITIEQSEFNGNVGRDSGGGAYFDDGTQAILQEVTFDGNQSFWGGGILVGWNAGVDASSSRFSGNRAFDSGGAIQQYDQSRLLLENTVLTHNESRMGGALSAQGMLFNEITNCTVAGNRADESGGAIRSDPQAIILVTNSIIWANEPNAWSTDSVVDARYSDIQGGAAGEGNLNADPRFIDLADGNVQLQTGSPCIDAADGDAAPATDRLDFPRYDDPATVNVGLGDPAFADLGAFEFNTCGNGSLEANEQCEGTDLGGNQNCQDLGFVGQGSIACTATCTFDLSDCRAACGNTVIEPTEACEPGNLNGATCTDLGFAAPEGLACSDQCEFDTSDCQATCGNGIVEPDEECEGTDLDGEDCHSQGFTDGQLKCTEQCRFDKRECHGGCGNDMVDMNEECDGQDTWGMDCYSFGFSGGKIACTDECTLDTSDCYYVCGNGMREGDEECDGMDVQANCQELGFLGGGELRCTGQCTLDASGCDTICGNDIIEPTEQCETGQLGGTTCESLGYLAGGELSCSECEFDESACLAECGNGAIEPGEECEGEDLDGLSCRDLGFATAEGLSCDSCALDASGCKAVCGNRVIEPGEACDDGNLSDADGCSANCALEEDWQCLGQPSHCNQCKAFHHGQLCDQCIILVDNDDRIETRDGQSWFSALATIKEGLELAETLDSACQVWVAEGAHYIYESDTMDTLWLADHSVLLGSFAGTESDPGQRIPGNHRTVLDSRADAQSAQRVNHVLTVEWSREVTIDGFDVHGAGEWDAGGGLIVRDGSATVRGCRFTPGTHQSGWGAVSGQNAHLVLENCVFTGNQGYALILDRTRAEVVHSSFYGNTPSAISMGMESDLQLSGSILFGNGFQSIDGTGSVLVEYSLVEGFSAGSGNITGDPLFVDPQNGDLRLQPGSPCVDAAHGDQAPLLDLDGYGRYDDPSKDNTGNGTPAYADMGAFEHHSCGNGQLDPNELCEGTDLGGLTCLALGYAAAGELACLPTCRYDTEGCTAICGNEATEPGEECDGALAEQTTCQDLGYTDPGTLTCSPDTCLFDTSGCAATCGNGFREPGEACEAGDLGGHSCEDQGFEWGELACNDDCSFDYRGCENGCGNDIVDWNEECDGQEINGAECHWYGYSTGTVTCSDDCRYDTSDCGYECGNQMREEGEECDGWDLGADCQDLGFLGGGELACTGECTYHTAGCHTICGNATVEPGEECEVGQLGDTTCASLGFTGGGELLCTDCGFNTSLCIAQCGNGIIEPTEACEEGDLNGQSCRDLGYADAAGLTCVECELNADGCAAVCGNRRIEPGEQCDDGNLEDEDGCSSSCAQEEDWQCLGEPSHCDDCEDFHHGAECGECIVIVNNDKQISSRDGKSWSTGLATIQDGIDLADGLGPHCEVWVTARTYHIFETNNNDTIRLNDRTALFGGFAGTEAHKRERDLRQHRTVLDNGTPDQGPNRVIHVLTAEWVKDVVIDGFTIQGNGDWDPGGGLLVRDASATVNGCRFAPGTGPGGWGALYAQNADLTVSNSEFIGNRGAGLVMDQTNATVLHCTFFDNDPAAITTDMSSDLTVLGSIISGNHPDGIQGMSPVLIEYSLVQDWFGGTGNLSGDPLFVDPEAGDLTLQAASPCIDAADGDEAPSSDMYGFARYDDPNRVNTGVGDPAFADMGAQERHSCGNGQLDAGEPCEGENLAGQTCADLGYAAEGTLACLPTCQLDTAGCEAVCDNGTIEPGEECETGDLGDATCQDLGYAEAGTLSCLPGLCRFDTSGCAAECGNGTREPGEDCEGGDLGEQTCASEGFEWGDLSCNPDCTFNFTGCVNGCGNGAIEWDEECDGSNTNGADCSWYGYSTGQVSCTDECRLDISDCGYECGNNMKEGDEECDGWDTGGQNCQAVGFVSPGNLRCHDNCTFDIAECTAQCGNGIVEPTENCEPGNLDGATCADLGYVTPDGLACAGDCRFDPSACQAECGNDTIEPTEQCEEGDLNNHSCRDLGYADLGVLGCSGCQFETSGCVAVCGNGLVEPGETCDDGNALGSDGCSSGCQPEQGWQCLGNPSRCDPCGAYFHGPSCDQCIVLVDLDDEITERDGKSWTTALATIQEGIDQAAALDGSCEVWVASGTYHIFKDSPNDTIRLENGVSLLGGFLGTESSPAQRVIAQAETVLDGRPADGGSTRVNRLITAEWVADVTIDGFTLRQAGQWDWGAGVWANNSWLTIANCAFEALSPHDGNAGAVYAGWSTVAIANSTFLNNQGGGITNDSSTMTVANCTIADNSPFGLQNQNGADTTVVGSIIWGNHSTGIEWLGGTMTVRYSDVQSWGTTNGNLSIEPKFVDLDNGDVRLQPDSPCIDAADGDHAPPYDRDGYPRYDDPTVTNKGSGTPDFADMGAYEVTACGDATVDPGEACDLDVGAASCLDAGFGTTDPVSCLPTCRFDTALCQSSCGNGLLEPDEQCEAGDVGQATCQDVGFAEIGALSCHASSCTFDLSGCTATCNNQLREPGEECDGQDLGQTTCEDLGFTEGGDVGCRGDCTFELNNCYGGCGNNWLEGHLGEECDGTDLGGMGCWQYGLCGELSCTDDCRPDLTSCEPC